MALFFNVSLRAFLTVLTAHLLVYFLIGALPEIGVAVLGIGAAQENALVEFAKQTELPNSYPDSLRRILSLDLGNSLSGVPVVEVLQESVLHSLPVFGISLTIVVAACATALRFPGLFVGKTVNHISEFFTFLPGYVPALVITAVFAPLGITVFANESFQGVIVAGFVVSIMPTALALNTIVSTLNYERRMPYAQTMRAIGKSETSVLRSLSRASLIQLSAIADKVITLQFAVIVFSEVIFSMPGFGSTLLLAAQRTDVNVLIAFVVVIAAVVSAARLFGTLIANILDPRSQNRSSVL